MQRAKTLSPELRSMLKFSPLQYMFDTVAEKPHYANIYVDKADAPSQLALLFGHYLFIGGNTDEPFLSDFIETELAGNKGNRLGTVMVFYDRANISLVDFFKGRFQKVFEGERSLYRHTSGVSYTDTDRVWKITKALMSSGIENAEMITEEILGTATYEDMEDFYNRGIGYAYLHDGRICAFCTSEYPSKASIAIGIAVDEEHRRKGIAAQMTHAFLKDAKARGLSVYWECWMKNEPSYKTALKCGFEKVGDYPVLVVVLN
jgi:RimJ/RimL family protein N-acetyltransferase